MSQAESIFPTVRAIVLEILGRSGEAVARDSALLGAIPEFDSMAVVAVLTALEDEFGVVIEDDEVDAGTFETFGTLSAFIAGKTGG